MLGATDEDQTESETNRTFGQLIRDAEDGVKRKHTVEHTIYEVASFEH